MESTAESIESTAERIPRSFDYDLALPGALLLLGCSPWLLGAQEVAGRERRRYTSPDRDSLGHRRVLSDSGAGKVIAGGNLATARRARGESPQKPGLLIRLDRLPGLSDRHRNRLTRAPCGVLS